MKILEDGGKMTPKAQLWCGILLVIFGPTLVAMQFADSAGASLPFAVSVLTTSVVFLGLGIFHIRQGARRVRERGPVT